MLFTHPTAHVITFRSRYAAAPQAQSVVCCGGAVLPLPRVTLVHVLPPTRSDIGEPFFVLIGLSPVHRLATVSSARLRLVHRSARHTQR